jgi:phosphinothricin acetyltransferase
MAGRITKTLEWTPWLVAVDSESDRVVGYAYASRHRERAGYRWSLDISVYVDEEWHGRGVGTQLYARLLELLRRQGFINVYAGITTPNPGSVRLHERIGMKPFATYEAVGYKHGQWLPVTWFHMRLQEPSEPPSEPIPFPQLADDRQVSRG